MPLLSLLPPLAQPAPLRRGTLIELKFLSPERERRTQEVSHLKDGIRKRLFNLFPELERNYNLFTKGMPLSLLQRTAQVVWLECSLLSTCAVLCTGAVLLRMLEF